MTFRDLNMKVSSTGGLHQENLPTVGKAAINKQGLRRKIQPLEDILTRAKQIPWSRRKWITKQLLMQGHGDRE